MKHIVFCLVIFMGFAIADGYCGGQTDKPGSNEQPDAATIANLTRENEALKGRNATLDERNAALSKENADLKANRGRLAPITWEIVEEAEDKILRELDYYLSAPLKLVINNHDRKLAVNNGMLTIEEKNDPQEVLIQTSDKGKLQNSNPKGGSFIINFQEENITLRFDRDREINSFVLVEVVNSPRNLTLHPDGVPPYLCILLDYKNDTENPMIRNVSSTAPGTPIIPDNFPPEDLPPVYQQFPSRNILGSGILSRESIVRYIQSKNRTVSWEIIDAVVYNYIVEARKENINHDIAIAQMCEGTAYLSKWEVISKHNYGDLQNIRGAVNNFSSIQLGVRAHIQQLKGYASLYGPTAERKVDTTRLNGIGRNAGKITTLDELFPVWVTKNLNNYRNEINTILAEMYIFQERQ